MPAAIALECDVSERGLTEFARALLRYQRETRRDMRAALRSGAVDLVKSLRAQTRRAPKLVPRADVRFGESDPKYYTGDDGRLFRRVVVARFFKGVRKNQVHWQPVQFRYVRRMGMRDGNYQGIVRRREAEAAMLREARNNFGKIRHWGLAKKSWGWFMHALFGKSVQDENPAAAIDARMVAGGIKETRAVLADGSIDVLAPIRCDIDIVNRLDYIRKALRPGALAQAVESATKSINHKISAGLKSRKFSA